MASLRHMPHRLRRLSLLAVALTYPLPAQEARVRPAEPVVMPAPADSNSPAFWRDDRLNWFGSTGQVLLSDGANQFGPFDTGRVELTAAYPAPHWMESVWTDEERNVWGWYHAEPVGLVEGTTLTAPKIGAVWSADGGKTLQDLGIVLESGDLNDPAAQNGFFIGGHGDFSVILNQERTHFYFFFGNYGGAPESQGVSMARMALADRFTPAGRIWKYHKGDWQEPGLLGRVTPIFPVRRPWQLRDPDAFWGPSVHWNTYLKCYVMLLNHAAGEPGWSQEGIYVSFCSNLDKPETWTPPARILSAAEVPAWSSFYPQIMGLGPGDTDSRAGKIARLYLAGASTWEIEFFPKAVATETPTDPLPAEPPPEEPPTAEPPPTATPAPPPSANPVPPPKLIPPH